jgi:tetratricopeptide (TPR) repeat protein
VAAEPHATAELAELCAHLPLALRIAAALLEDQPGRSIRDYVSELSGADRLTALTVAGDEQEAVRAAFDLSERSLPADTRRVFRLLGLVPGDVDADTVAALAGVEVSQARLALDRLTGANLLDVRPGGRYAPHDLLRLYARELAEARDEPADRQAAVGRVLTYYADGVDAAARRIYPHMQRLPRDPSAREFPTGAAAATWLDAERRNLVDAVLAAAAAGPRPIAWQLADGLRGFFWLRRHAADWLAVAEAGLRAATDDGDHRGQAAAHLSLGQVKRWLARHTEAVAHYDRACALSRAAGWADGEAAALGSLANVYRDQGRLAAAAEQYRQVAELAQRTGNRTGAAVTHGNLGNVYLQLGRLHEALTEYDQCLALSTELGSRIVANMALDGLGAVYLELGESEQALDHLARALAGHRGTGSREGEADAMVVMAEVHRRAGRSTAARADARAGLELAREAGVSRVEVDALTCLGILDQDRGRLTLARTLAVQTSYRYGETVALIGLAEIATDPGQARTEATRAADLARGSGFALLEARARLFLKDAAYFKLQPNGS